MPRIAKTFTIQTEYESLIRTTTVISDMSGFSIEIFYSPENKNAVVASLSQALIPMISTGMTSITAATCHRHVIERAYQQLSRDGLINPIFVSQILSNFPVAIGGVIHLEEPRTTIHDRLISLRPISFGHAEQSDSHPSSAVTLGLTADEIAVAAMIPNDSEPDIDELTARVLTSVDYYLTRHTDSTRENSGLYQMMIPEPLHTARDRFFNLPAQSFGFQLPELPRDHIRFVGVQDSASRHLSPFGVEHPVETNVSKLEHIGFSEDNFTSEEEANYKRYCCSINLKIMTNPVYDPRFREYQFEKSDILRWLDIKQKHPFTRARLTPDMLIPNLELKHEIDQFVEATMANNRVLKK